MAEQGRLRQRLEQVTNIPPFSMFVMCELPLTRAGHCMSRRPLTQSQLDYASLDAWALTQIFSVMSERWDHRSFLGEYVYNKQKKNKGRGITEGAQPPL